MKSRFLKFPLATNAGIEIAIDYTSICAIYKCKRTELVAIDTPLNSWGFSGVTIDEIITMADTGAYPASGVPRINYYCTAEALK